MTAKNRPLTGKLAELGAAVESASVRVREVGRQHQEAKAEAGRAREEVVELFASGDDAAAGKAQARRLKAEAEASGPWEEKVDGAKRAVQRAEADRVTFAMQNYAGLLAERTPDAEKVAADVEAAVETLRAAHKAWHAVQGEIEGLLWLAGRTGQHTPMFPQELEDLVRDARRAGGLQVPAPLPRDAAEFSIASEHDPDPEVREAARERIGMGEGRRPTGSVAAQAL